jgi:hypothetical protein
MLCSPSFPKIIGIPISSSMSTICEKITRSSRDEIPVTCSRTQKIQPNSQSRHTESIKYIFHNGENHNYERNWHDYVEQMDTY